MKVGIIGNGLVGSTAAYAIALLKAANEIVMVDKDTKRSAAEAADIQHALPFVSASDVYSGRYKDLTGCKVIVHAAGVSQKPGESRLMLLERNAAILREVITSAIKYAPEAIFIIATNPVDIITHLSVGIAAEVGVPRERIIGTGTTLDTARFRALLGRQLGVDPHHVHGYVAGEHGDSEVLIWSNIDVGGISLNEFIKFRNVEFNDVIRKEIESGVRNAAYKIIEGKGSTYYGIGAAIARLVDIIGRDNRAILTISTRVKEIVGVKDVTLSLPHLIGGDGDLGVLPLKLNGEEKDLLEKSALIIRGKLDEYESK
jgi:L-lactate dehydrogenase